MTKTDIKKKKILRATVVSDKMDKTIVVEVQSFKKDPKYKKFVKSHKRYKVHDPENVYKVGDKVEIVTCTPISKDKKFEIAE